MTSIKIQYEQETKYLILQGILIAKNSLVLRFTFNLQLRITYNLQL